MSVSLRQRRSRMAAWVLLFSVLVSVARAQTVTLHGSVQDASGAVLGNATVQVYQAERIVSETRTSADGQYTLSLPAGEYRIEATAINFASNSETVTVRQGMAPLILKLELAPVLQSVEVQDEPYQISLEPDRNLTGLVLDEQAVQDLPEDEEELAQLLRDLAGPGADAVGGASIFTDGFSEGRLPPRDQIREIRINNNPFSAENSQPGHGRIEIITRAGSDNLRGSVGFEFEDESLNARNFFADTRPPHQQRDWRANLSGPLIRGRMSFSLFASRSVEEESDTVNATTPTGPVNLAIVSPSRGQEYNGRTQYNLPANHFLNVSLQYGNESSENDGIGGFTLPERATESSSNDFSLQIRETAPLSERLLHETRFSWSRNHDRTLPVNNALAIDVLDAFEGGGATSFNRSANDNFQFGNLLSYSRGSLTMRGGFQGNFRRYRTESRSNFRGTFEFPGLDAYSQGRPTKFTITSGDPFLNMSQFEWGAFVQNDYRASQALMLSFGLRYEEQTNIGDSFNLDPRFGFAYGLGGATVVRGGMGWFHQRLSAGTVQSVMRLDGTRQLQTILTFCQVDDLPGSDCVEPSFPNPFATGGTGERPAPSIRRAAEGLELPYNLNSGISLETRLPKGLFVSASYEFIRGLHLYRSRNINAPLPGEADPLDPAFRNILLLESSASSRYHELSFRINQRLGRHSLNLNYTLGSNYDDTNGATNTPANTYDLRGEWGPSSNNRRHSVNGGANVQLPWRVSSNLRLRANTGRPYTITTGHDDNNDTFTNDRPVGVTRNTETGPGFFTMDLSLRKTFTLKRAETAPAGNGNPSAASQFQGPQGGGGRDNRGGGYSGGGYPGGGGGGGSGGSRRDPELSLSINVSNLLNHTNFSRYSGVLTSQFFGRANSANSPREIELGLQFSF